MENTRTPTPPPLPVICDTCKAAGMAGDDAFADIPDLLAFEPVPRRAHANGWTPEHQRAFIAALAITGSARQAAKYVGRAAFGAEQLRTAKGGRSFAAAWDAAMEIARDRELARLHENLGELAKKTEEAHAQARESGRPVPGDDVRRTQSARGADEYGEEDDGAYDREMEEVRERLFDKLQRMRCDMLRETIIPFPEKRAAWVVLYGAEEIEAVENGTWTGAKWNGPDTAPTPSSSQSRSDGEGDHAEHGGGVKGAAAPPPPPKPDDKPGPRIRKL